MVSDAERPSTLGLLDNKLVRITMIVTGLGALFAEADTLPELREAVRDAVRCHFEDNERSKVIRLRYGGLGVSFRWSGEALCLSGSGA